MTALTAIIWFYLPRGILHTACMSTTELIARELTALPESEQRKVYEFAHALRLQNADQVFDGLLLSEAGLAKDWNTPEEDAAWASL